MKLNEFFFFDSGRVFVSTLTRIQENIACDPSCERQRSDLNLKLKQTLHAPLASPEEFTPSPTKSLTTGAHHPPHGPHPLSSRSALSSTSSVQGPTTANVQSGKSKSSQLYESGHQQVQQLGEKGLLSRVAQRKLEEAGGQPVPMPRSGAFPFYSIVLLE